MKRLIEITHCSQCPHLERNLQPARLKDKGWNCKKLPQLKKDLGGNHVSEHIIKQYDADMESFMESQKGPFPRTDQPRDPFYKLWVDNCPLDKA